LRQGHSPSADNLATAKDAKHDAVNLIVVFSELMPDSLRAFTAGPHCQSRNRGLFFEAEICDFGGIAIRAACSAR
jgi:hypothetical protein